MATTATGLYRYYSGLPTWARAVVIIAMILIIFIIILWIRKLIKQAEEKHKQQEKDQEYVKDFQKYCSGKANQGKASYPPTSYIQMASSLYQAGCYEDTVTCGGTDEDAIKSIFLKMNSVCDVLQLSQAFGERPKQTYDTNSFLGNLNPLVWVGISNYNAPKYPLGAWLRTEMDNAEVEKYVNGVLTEKGIDYQF